MNSRLGSLCGAKGADGKNRADRLEIHVAEQIKNRCAAIQAHLAVCLSQAGKPGLPLEAK